MCESIEQACADEEADSAQREELSAEDTAAADASVIETLTRERDDALRAYESSVLANHGVKKECAGDVLLLAKAAGGSLDEAVKGITEKYPCFCGERSRLTLSLPLTEDSIDNDSALRQAFGL